jgi:hypothetical protein
VTELRGITALAHESFSISGGCAATPVSEAGWLDLRPGRSSDWIKLKNPAVSAVKREGL